MMGLRSRAKMGLEIYIHRTAKGYASSVPDHREGVQSPKCSGTDYENIDCTGRRARGNWGEPGDSKGSRGFPPRPLLRVTPHEGGFG